MIYRIKIDPNALIDIQEITDWYNLKLSGLGTRFHKDTILLIDSLKKRPLRCAIRYANIRCLVFKKFPFMVHYAVDETKNEVIVYAIFHTSRNPRIWANRNLTHE